MHMLTPYILYIGNKRTRCGECLGCTSSNCGSCKYCHDNPRFGGPGKLKQACAKRKCTMMQITSTVKTKNPPKQPGYTMKENFMGFIFFKILDCNVDTQFKYPSEEVMRVS